MKEIEKAAIEEANELVTAGKADIADEEYSKLQVAFLDGVKFGKGMMIEAFIHSCDMYNRNGTCDDTKCDCLGSDCIFVRKFIQNFDKLCTEK